MQYNFADPANFQGSYVVLKKGQVTVGYPVFSVNRTNDHTFSQDWVKGFHLGASVSLAWGLSDVLLRDRGSGFPPVLGRGGEPNGKLLVRL